MRSPILTADGAVSACSRKEILPVLSQVRWDMLPALSQDRQDMLPVLNQAKQDMLPVLSQAKQDMLPVLSQIGVRSPTLTADGVVSAYCTQHRNGKRSQHQAKNLFT